MTRTKRATAWSLSLVALTLLLAPATTGGQPDEGGGSQVSAPARKTASTESLAEGPAEGRGVGLLCEGGGRYRVDGEPPVLGRDTRIDTVTISGRQISLGPAFAPVPIVLHLSEQGTLVQARLAPTPALPRGAQLHGVIRGDTCSRLEGVLRVPGRGRDAVFHAFLVLCREGVEECAPEDLVALRFLRWVRQFQERAFPLGYIPKGALGSAHAELARAPSTLGRWVSLGPAPARVEPPDPTHSEAADTNSGRVQAIAVDPATDGHWLIGAASGGVWETRDAGTTWAPRTDDQPSLTIGALAFAPGMPSVAYAGTGTYYFSSSAYPGAGLLKSVDGGTTWSLLAAGTFGGLGFSSIQVSPADADTLVAATGNRDNYETSQNHSPPANPKSGLYRSTTGGQQWDLVLSGQATDLAAHPTDFSRQYAAFGDQIGDAANGVYRSIDGGQTWQKIPGPWTAKIGGVGETRLALSPPHPDILYVSIRNANDGKGKDNSLLGLWKTTNAWAPVPSWVEIAVPAQNDYAAGVPNHTITVNPVFPDVIYAGGVELWKYDDGTWVEYGKSFADIHADQAALAWAFPRILVGNDGGVYSKDELSPVGGPWHQHNTNLAITHLAGGAVHPAAADRPLAGAWDLGVVQRDPASGSTWLNISGGDGQGAFFGSSPQHFGVHVWGPGDVQRTTDGGATYDSTVFDNIPGWSSDAGYSAWGALRPCPANEDVVLLPADTLWRADNFFSAPTGQDVAWVEDAQFTPSLITAVAFAPSDTTCGTYAFATQTGRIFLHRAAGGPLFWFDLDPGQQLPGRYATGLAFSPVSADTLYVTFSGFDQGTPGKPGHVFKTTSATGPAPTWLDVSPPANLPHHVVTVDPTSPATVYVGTDMGLWVSLDGAATWAHAGPAAGLPNAPVRDIVVDPCGATAFTWGRGAFRQAVPFVCP